MHLKKFSKHWLTLSVCPSVCEWYAEDKWSSTPRFLKSDYQTELVNIGSLSMTMTFVNPCNLNTFAM
jgi:hypothetical protein